MRRANGLSGLLRRYLRLEGSKTLACNSGPANLIEVQRLSLHTGSLRASVQTGCLHHNSCNASLALPSKFGHRAAFDTPPGMSLFSVCPQLLAALIA